MNNVSIFSQDQVTHVITVIHCSSGFWRVICTTTMTRLQCGKGSNPEGVSFEPHMSRIVQISVQRERHIDRMLFQCWSTVLFALLIFLFPCFSIHVNCDLSQLDKPNLKHTTTLFDLSDHDIVSQE